MKDEHLTLRLPRNLARALTRLARGRRVSRSAVVREAVERYVAPEVPAAGPPPPVTAAELADRWARLPRLAPEEAAGFEEDILMARRDLPPPSPWE